MISVENECCFFFSWQTLIVLIYSMCRLETFNFCRQRPASHLSAQRFFVVQSMMHVWLRDEKVDESLNGSFQHSAFVVQSNYLKQSLFSNRTILVTDSQSWSGFCFLDQFKRNSVKWDTGTNKKIGQFNDKYKNQGHIESSIYLLEWFI